MKLPMILHSLLSLTLVALFMNCYSASINRFDRNMPLKRKLPFSESVDAALSHDAEFSPLKVMCELNGYSVPAIIDTGAQITIISSSCARRCRVSNLINTKFSGRAIGVGVSEILGRVDNLPLRVGPVTFRSQVSVLRESSVDFLIGMDFLQRFKCDICLTEGVLKLRVRDRPIRIPLMTSRSYNANYNNEDVEINESEADEIASGIDNDEWEDDYEGYQNDEIENEEVEENLERRKVSIYSVKKHKNTSKDEDCNDAYPISLEGV